MGPELVRPELCLDRSPESLDRREVSVVCRVLSRLAPHHLLRVQLRAVLRQRVDPQPVPVRTQERTKSFRFVVGDVVEDEADSPEPAEEIDEKSLERTRVELDLASIDECGTLAHGDRAVVLGAALARMMVDDEPLAAAGPAPPRRPFLLEVDLILEDDSRSPEAGVFLILGKVRLSQRSCASLSASASFSLGNWMLKPN